MALVAGIALALSFVATSAEARPEKIRPGIPYYSDDCVEKDGVWDIAQEKNYEEVYQFYSYYEVVYDADERVEIFKEYRRGDVIREERYRYDASGKLIERSVARPGKPVEVVPIPSIEPGTSAPAPSS